jgi:hypothetical protein
MQSQIDIPVAKADVDSLQPGNMVLIPDDADPWPAVVVRQSLVAGEKTRILTCQGHTMSIIDFDGKRCRNGVLILDRDVQLRLSVDHGCKVTLRPKREIGCLAFTERRVLIVADYDRGNDIHKTMVVDTATWALENYPEDELAPAIWLPEWQLLSFRGEVLASPELMAFRGAQRVAAPATEQDGAH